MASEPVTHEVLDRIHAQVWPRALTGDLAAVHTILLINEHRARLLDLPTHNQPS